MVVGAGVGVALGVGSVVGAAAGVGVGPAGADAAGPPLTSRKAPPGHSHISSKAATTMTTRPEPPKTSHLRRVDISVPPVVEVYMKVSRPLDLPLGNPVQLRALPSIQGKGISDVLPVTPL
ncbi:MAG: hypothetical protein OXU28_01520 [Chloroflexota bacterium]|nr:hypothetical protein [Chloroflexota bacterium]